MKNKKVDVFLEKIPISEDSIFVLTHDDNAKFDYPLHYHEELEINLVMNCRGKRVVGDNVEIYDLCDLVMIGPNTPHCWYRDDKLIAPEEHAKVITLQFKESVFSDVALNSLVMKPIKTLLLGSKRGYQFYGGTEQKVIKLLLRLIELKGFEAYLLFLEIIHTLAESKEVRKLAMPGYIAEPDESKSTRINKVYKFISENYQETVSLAEAASLIGMSESAFSRFFKKFTNLSFTDYVNYLRIGYASKLLIQSNHTVSQICYMSGFRNVANFNRQFKKKYNYSPSYYRLHYKEKRKDEQFTGYDRLVRY
ncbi:AraC family transcriptional regulator [Hymenobacter armeniacus]|uniref:Helix-turn-helix transcriptional regulator n=1 Tax=Hymenobacter armeniacus TaxID=2771358 RepID=A0ABR8JT07_9BACT|nr:AraC family transcriptional regulator [Hymenobacter armeniacus]MBD2723111.1 helix-turn-helix transcriptional regulator [Hymenobacter armeniacus]